MIKNKILNIKIILKNIKNILDFQTNFWHTKIREQFFKNYSKNVFFKIIF